MGTKTSSLISSPLKTLEKKTEKKADRGEIPSLHLFFFLFFFFFFFYKKNPLFIWIVIESFSSNGQKVWGVWYPLQCGRIFLHILKLSKKNNKKSHSWLVFYLSLLSIIPLKMVSKPYINSSFIPFRSLRPCYATCLILCHVICYILLQNSLINPILPIWNM